MRKAFFSLIPLVVSSTVACTAADTTEPETAAAGSALETRWQPLLTCEGGAVLDVNEAERRNLQLVIRDPNVIRYLNQVGAVRSAYAATEVILSGWTGRVNWTHGLGPRLEAQPYGGPGVFGAGEFREMITDHDTYDGAFGRFVRVAREGEGIRVQFGAIEKRGCAETETHYVGDGFGYVTSCVADYSAYVEKASWYFQSCR